MVSMVRLAIVFNSKCGRVTLHSSTNMDLLYDMYSEVHET